MADQNTGNIVDATMKDKGLRILAYVLLTLIIIFCCIIIFKVVTGQYVKLFGMEFNIPETKQEQSVPKNDTVSVGEAPTTRSPIPLKQNNKFGKNESNQNSGAISGMQGGQGNKQENHIHTVNGVNDGVNGDVTIVNGRRLTEADKKTFDDFVNKQISQAGFKPRKAVVTLVNGSNGQIFFTQLVQYLKEQGYQVYTGTEYLSGNGKLMAPVETEILASDSSLHVSIDIVDN